MIKAHCISISAEKLETIIAEIPNQHGTYALHLYLPNPKQLRVGHLGEFTFPAGDYLYQGSAFGPGGLRARLGRHLRGGNSPHWHVDVLREVAGVAGFYYLIQDTEESAQSLECIWSQALACLPGARAPVPGFGASDCRAGCAAHIIFWPDSPPGIRVSPGIIHGALSEATGKTKYTSSVVKSKGLLYRFNTCVSHP
jgi:Uri superfamily endonuclease